jgi:dTDP-4-amino-4,6-dideoxygalactose transaminase
LIPEPENSGLTEWNVPLSEPDFSIDEVRAVAETLSSGWWTAGPEIKALEEEFAAKIGARHAVAVSSGTAALHLAFLALGLKEGDDVLTPSLTFVAAPNMMLHIGASPAFADVESINEPVVSAATLERALTPATRGICVTHYGGYPCEMDEIMKFARKRKLWVVEDAAHAPGASWKGVPCGRWGNIAIFSFFGNKNITCAEGGMAVTGNGNLARRMRLLRSHGMNSVTWDRFKGHAFSYDVTMPGFNYRLDDLRASLLRAQLRSLDRINALRSERDGWYRELLGGDERWILPFDGREGVSSHHLFTVVLDEKISRENVMRRMKERGVQTSIHYPPAHRFSCYRKLNLKRPPLANTEKLGRRILTLPMYPGLTETQARYVAKTFREAADAENQK